MSSTLAGTASAPVPAPATPASATDSSVADDDSVVHVFSDATRKRKNLTPEDRLRIVTRRVSSAETVDSIARDYGVSAGHIRNIVSRFKLHGGETTVPSTRGGRRPGRPALLTKEEKQTVLGIVDERSHLTLAELRQYCRDEIGKELTVGYLSRLLSDNSYKLKVLREVPVQRTSPETIAARRKWADWALTTLMHQEAEIDKLVFMDEGGFNTHIHRTLGYAAIGQRATVSTNGARGGSLTMLVAIKVSTAHAGLVYTRQKLGPVNGAEISKFLQELCVNTDGTRRIPAGHIVVLDNCPVHKTSVVKAAAAELGLEMRYLPPYSPFLNPVEQALSAWKAEVKHAVSYNTVPDLLTRVQASTTSITPAKCREWFAYSQRYWLRCAHGERILY